MPKKLSCKYLQNDKDGHLYCAFTVGDNEGLSTCRSFIDVPRIETLLPKEEKEEQKSYLDAIREKVREEHATLALGAGISIPAGLPGWCGLISRLFGYALQFSRYSLEEGIESKKQIQKSRVESALIKGGLTMFEGGNVLEAGQYVIQMLESALGYKIGEEMLKEPISAIIHEGRRAYDLNGAKRCKIDRTKISQAKKDSLRAVAYLLQAKNGFRRAITYNYDTLVEECLIDLFKIDPRRIISHPGGWSTILHEEKIEDQIDIFHVHGCVLRREYQGIDKYARLRESKRIILSEDSYYNAEQQETYNWMNSIQSYYLNRDTCVFVGFSADDYNFRRILRQMGKGDQIHKDKPKHYLILTVDDLVKDIWHNVCRSYLSEKDKGTIDTAEICAQVRFLLYEQLKAKRKYWKRYNFFPIWVTVPDIPKTLLSII